MAFLLRRSHLGTGHNEDERTSSFSGSERRISRHSSIEGPYRDGTKDTNFPIYCTIENPSAEPRIYARSLLPLGNGFGLNVALGSESRPKLHMSQGAVIGDVGIMDSNGSFEFWFNLFLPPDHPNQPTKTMPPNFSPLHPPLSKEELLTVPDHFPPGTVIASDGVKISRISSSPLKVEFETSAREGAALVLPTGASREDIIDPSRIYPYVKEHAIDWYQGYNGNGEIIAGEPVSNGTVWVITGVDRSTSWAMATFPEDSSNSGKYTRFKYNGENSESVWEDDQRCSPDYQLQNFSDGTQGAIFLRVLAVALSPLEWSGHVTHIPSDCVPHYTVLSTPRVGLRAWVQRAMARILSSTSHASIDTPQVFFHPSIILLHILLLTDPLAVVAVVADSVWCSQLSKRHLNHSEVIKLMRRVIDNYDVVNTDGVVTFSPKQYKADTSHRWQRGLTASIGRIIPWVAKYQEEELNAPILQNMFKVLSVPE